MKKLLLLTCTIFSHHSYALDCENLRYATQEDIIHCSEIVLKKSNETLQATYQKLYSQTTAKKALKEAEKAWETYKQRQCDFLEEINDNRSMGAISDNISCHILLTRERIKMLESSLQ